MARMEVGKGIEISMKIIANASKSTTQMMKRAVYPVAGFMADKISAALSSLPTVDGKDGKPPYARPGEKLSSISSVQKQDLIKSFGISRFENQNGFINVKLGFNDYGSYPTKAHPKGIPNALLIRSLEKGTSFLKKNNIITKTVKANQKAAERMLEENLKKIIEKEL